MTEIGTVGFAIDRDDIGRAAAFEALGFDTLWLSGGQISDTSVVLDLLAATERASVGTAVLSGSTYQPDDVVALHRAAAVSAPGRLMLGVGGPQAPQSLAAVGTFLDALAEASVPRDDLLLAALGPKKRAIAAERTAGPMVLLVTPDYLRQAKHDADDATVVVQLPVVLDDDAARARDAARGMIGGLSGLPGYRSHLERIGFATSDVEQVSDALVDALVAHGSPATVDERVEEYLEAGADHVFAQVLHDGDQPAGLEAAELVAGAVDRLSGGGDPARRER